MSTRPGRALENWRTRSRLRSQLTDRIINLSLAILGGRFRTILSSAAALNYAELKGAVVVVAAGNQGQLGHGAASIAFRYGSRCRGGRRAGFVAETPIWAPIIQAPRRGGAVI